MLKAAIRMNIVLYSTLWLLCAAHPACGSETWSAIYPGGENDRIASIQETADGGCIVAGFTNDWGANNYFWLLRLDGKGSVVWKRAYGNGGNFSGSGLLMQETPGGGYVVACTLSFGPGNEDIQVIKLQESLLENFQLILIYFMICFAKKLLKQIKRPIQWKLKHFYTLY